MKREEIKALFENATDEQIDKIMSINGADVEKAKGKLTAVEAELKKKNEAFDDLSAQFEELKTKNASAEDWEKKFNELTEKIKADNEKAEADRKEKEKADSISSRFSSVVGDKKFNHEAIKNDYLKKFGEALENKEFEGKSDAEILHELTKDDKEAFKGVTAFNLAGATTTNAGKTMTKEQIRAIKDTGERQKAMLENFDLYE